MKEYKLNTFQHVKNIVSFIIVIVLAIIVLLRIWEIVSFFNRSLLVISIIAGNIAAIIQAIKEFNFRITLGEKYIDICEANITSNFKKRFLWDDIVEVKYKANWLGSKRIRLTVYGDYYSLNISRYKEYREVLTRLLVNTSDNKTIQIDKELFELISN